MFISKSCHLKILFSQKRFASINEIVKVNDLTEIMQRAYKLDANGLAAFDVDKTLIVPRDKIATDIHFSKIQKLMSELCKDHVAINRFHSLIYLQSQKEIIDPRSFDLVRVLSDKKVRTIALTALSRGSFGAIDDVLRWRIEELKELGYDFESGFDPNFCFQFKDAVPKALPAFRKGVLFSSTLPKGEILKIFLERMQWRPSCVLFVEDQLKSAVSVTETMRAMEIDSYAFHYTAAEHAGSDLNEEQTRFQIRYLLENGVWLSDIQSENRK